MVSHGRLRERAKGQQEESAIPGISMPSSEELASRGGDFQLLPEDEYVVEVKEITVNKDQRNPYNDEVRDTLTVKSKPIKFADGSPLVDIDGDDVSDDKLVFDFIDPTKVGMKPQPSKARKFFTSCLGLPVGSGFDIEDYSELIGSRLIASVIVKDGSGDKGPQNRVTAYRAIPKRPVRKAAVEVAEDDSDDAVAEATAPSKAPRTLPGEKVQKSRTKAAKADDLVDDDDDDF